MKISVVSRHMWRHLGTLCVCALIISSGWIPIIPLASALASPLTASGEMRNVDPDVFLFLAAFKRLVDGFDPASLGSLSEEFEVELRRELPAAYTTDIRMQQVKSQLVLARITSDTERLRFFASLLIPLSNGINFDRLCDKAAARRHPHLPTLRTLCGRGKTLNPRKIEHEIDLISSRLLSIALNEISAQAELREVLRRTQFQNMKNIILRNNGASITTAFVDPTELQSANNVRSARGNNTCTALLVENNLVFIRKLLRVHFRPSLKDRKKLPHLAEQVEEYRRTPNKCPFPQPTTALCAQAPVGSREYFRAAAAAAIQDIQSSLSALEAGSATLTIDDWRIARNILLMKILSASDFNVSALNAPNACGKEQRR